MSGEHEALLAGARAGDKASFEQLVGPHRRELVMHCYRLTGSLSDADDMAQESLYRAWRGIAAFDGRASLRTWLYRIATNACLTEIERRPKRGLPDAFYPATEGASFAAAPIAEPIWLEPCPRSLWDGADPLGPEQRVAARESVAIAFLSIIQNLPPLQRAVLIFRDVLGWPAAETAEALEITVAAANSALQRARASLDAFRAGSREGPLEPSDARARELLGRYVRAWEAGDVDAIAALLHEDAKLTMPPTPIWLAGRPSIAQFLAAILSAGPVRAFPIEASGLPAMAFYARAPGESTFSAGGIHVIAFDAHAAARVDAFLDPSLFRRFGLPHTVPDDR